MADESLRVPHGVLGAVIAHARADHPDEACGVLIGPAEAPGPAEALPFLNAARSPTFYEFDSADVLALHRRLASGAERLFAIYHSHTATPAYPSATDIAYAGYPEAHYLIVSTRECGNGPGPVEVRCFRITDGQVREEAIDVVDEPPAGAAPPTGAARSTGAATAP